MEYKEYKEYKQGLIEKNARAWIFMLYVLFLLIVIECIITVEN